MAVHLAFDWRRRQKSRPASLESEPIATNTSPEAHLVQEEQLSDVLNALGRLTELTRQAFVMRYIEQDSYEVIARHLEKTLKQVRALCHKAVVRLRATLNSKAASPNAAKEVIR